jgi:flagellar FliJ protein
MKRFRFSLETVLRVKRQVEEARQRELGAAQVQRQRAYSRLGAYENGLRELVREQADARSGVLDLNAIAWYQARHKAISDSIKSWTRRLQELTEAEEAARLRVVEAAKERRVLEKLEETQRQAWLEKLNTEEQNFMDELAQRARTAMERTSASATGL